MNKTLQIIFYFFAVIIVGWLLYRAFYLLKKRYQYRKALSSVYNNQGIPTPKFKIGHTYSYPSFEIVFENKEQFELAESKDLNKIYNGKIKTIHKDIADFDPNLAIFYTWNGNK